MRPLDAVWICSSPRTGSGLLCSALWSTGLCGRPDEYLGPMTRRDYEAQWGCSGDRDYAERVIAYATTPNGVFSMKVHWEQVQRASWLAEAAPGGRGVVHPFVALAPRAHFFWLRRRDKVRQAISLHVRQETGQFRRLGGDPATPTAHVAFDYDAIHHFVDEMEEYDRSWGRFFDELGVSPTPIWYEDHLEHHYAETARSILRTVGVEIPPDLAVASEYRKLSDEASEILVRRFREAECRAGHD